MVHIPEDEYIRDFFGKLDASYPTIDVSKNVLETLRKQKTRKYRLQRYQRHGTYGVIITFLFIVGYAVVTSYTASTDSDGMVWTLFGCPVIMLLFWLQLELRRGFY